MHPNIMWQWSTTIWTQAISCYSAWSEDAVGQNIERKLPNNASLLPLPGYRAVVRRSCHHQRVVVGPWVIAFDNQLKYANPGGSPVVIWWQHALVRASYEYQGEYLNEVTFKVDIHCTWPDCYHKVNGGTCRVFESAINACNIFSCDQVALRTLLSVRPSVRPSVCHTFFTMFPSSFHHEIFSSDYQWQKWYPCKRSRSKVKVT